MISTVARTIVIPEVMSLAVLAAAGKRGRNKGCVLKINQKLHKDMEINEPKKCCDCRGCKMGERCVCGKRYCVESHQPNNWELEFIPVIDQLDICLTAKDPRHQIARVLAAKKKEWESALLEKIKEEIISRAEPYEGAKWHNTITVEQVVSILNNLK